MLYRPESGEVTRMRKGYFLLVAAVCILLAVLLATAAICVFLDGPARRAEDPTAEIYTPEAVAERLAPCMPMLAVLAGLLAAGFIWGVQAPGAGCRVKAGSPIKQKTAVKHEKRVRGILIAAAIFLIIAGILNGSARDVLVKAITICTECIGLG